MLRPQIFTTTSTNMILNRWEYRALPHEIQYDATQAPNYPFQIKGSIAPSTSTPTRMLLGVGL